MLHAYGQTFRKMQEWYLVIITYMNTCEPAQRISEPSTLQNPSQFESPL